MVVRKNEMRKEIKTGIWGGTGDIEVLHFVEKENLKNSRLFAYVTVPKDGSIGLHEHKGETEYFVIMSGQALADDNGVEKSVGEGDILITGSGNSHSIRNTGNSDLIIIAVIIKD